MQCQEYIIANKEKKIDDKNMQYQVYLVANERNLK